MSKRGQVTIFVIIAIAIVALIALLLYFNPFPTLFGGGEISPNSFLGDCIEDDLRAYADLLAKNGGYEKPEGTVMFMSENYKFLCYSAEYYKTCTVQQPFIKNNFENELSRMLKPKAELCAQSLIDAYKNRGYNILSNKKPSVNVSVEPGRMKVNYEVDLTLSKDGKTEKVKSFDSTMTSELYDLMFIAGDIVESEATYGDSETTLYMQYYPDLKIEKIERDGGDTIYKLTNVVTDEQFRFASRSLAWPAGYGAE